MLPADIPELASYPRVGAFISHHLSMQFGDVRSMMRLPLPDLGITHACNFAATATVCGLISGISVSLYTPRNWTKKGKKGPEWVGSGRAFKSLLEDFYPWRSTKPRNGAEAIYDVFRNPLAHALGVENQTVSQVRIIRLRQGTGLTEDELEEIERSQIRPSWLDPGLSRAEGSWDLLVEGFYRDAFHMLWKLVSDADQMRKAESRFSRGTIIWRNGKPPAGPAI